MFKPFDSNYEDFFGLRSADSLFGIRNIFDATFIPTFAQDSDTALNFPADFEAANLSFGCGCSQHVKGEDHIHDGDGHFDVYPHYHGPDGVALADDGGNDNADGGGPALMEGDVPADTTTTAVVTVDTAYVGELEVGFDNDWIRIEVVEGQRYQINVDGTGANALVDPLVSIRDQNGNFLASNDDANNGRNSEISFSADYTGVYYIDVTHWQADEDPQPLTGEYTVTAQEVDPLTEYTYDEIADYLTDGSWTRRTHDDRDGDASNGTTITYHIDDLPAATQALALAAMQAWADVANLNFVEVTLATAADLRFEDGDNGAYAATTTAGAGNISSVRINVSQADWIDTYGTDINSYSYQTYIHEIGHALGLGHSGPYNGSAVYNFNNIYTNDSWATTVMSYFDQNEAGSGTARLVLGTQVADILAIQNLYGANTTTRDGDSIYGFNSTETGSIYDSQAWMDQGIRLPSFSIWDADGTDTFDFSGYVSNQTISLIAETFSSVGDNTNTAVTTDALQNIISISRGTVIENAIGGTGDDTITGNEVNNEIEGGLGADLIYSLGGVDTVLGGAGNDGLVLGAGNDTGRGGDGDDQIYGQAGDDQLFGEGGVDRLYGGEGNDTVDAGDGNDVAVTGAGADIVMLGLGDDTAYGQAGNDTINGDGGNDTIFGEDGNDTLNGGDGLDVLISGGGDDTVNGDAGDDIIYGQAGADTINGGANNDTIFGGTENDILSGGVGIDLLLGEDGDDTLNGGDDNDFLYGQNGNDTINGGTGNDTVFAGLGNDIVDGGAGDDVMAGEDGNDTMDGGLGADVVNGLAGNDRVTGGQGDNIVLGGTEADVFHNIVGGIDRILDFQQGTDRIELDSSITSFAQLQGLMVDADDGAGGTVLIINNGGAGTFVVTGHTTASILQSDFNFTGATSAEKVDSPPVAEAIDSNSDGFVFAENLDELASTDNGNVSEFELPDLGAQLNQPTFAFSNTGSQMFADHFAHDYAFDMSVFDSLEIV